ncbi:hypothetical protein SAY86_010659 [Trapa natans]|uniref:Uncharacterized protein n=1 Tax=Trapa natans TaxID=22666 RepID=A0AAN7R4E6_TRANT|nr:hypothetical protein SAY86_010659 [Trapa natans]
MGRSPCPSGKKDIGIRKGAWTTAEDMILTDYIAAHGEGKWRSISKQTGLKRSGKSCRLRWLNYLRPDIKRGNITRDEEDLIIRLHKLLGNRWSLIAGRLPGRTDNEVKNYWNSYLSKQVIPRDHKDEQNDTVNNTVKNNNKEAKMEDTHQLMMPSPAAPPVPPPFLPLEDPLNLPAAPASPSSMCGEGLLSPDITTGMSDLLEPAAGFSSFDEFGFGQFDLVLEGDWGSLQCIEESYASHYDGSWDCTALNYITDEWIL